MKPWVFLIIFVLAGCGDKSLCEKCLKTVHAMHNTGDKLFFKSTTGDIDTIVISNAELSKSAQAATMDHKPYYYTRISIKHLPVNHWLRMRELRGDELIDIDEALIRVSCRKEDDLIDVHCMFRGHWGDTTFSDEIDDEFSVYLEPAFANGDEIVNQLFFNKKIGLVKYIKNDSIEYTRIE